MPSISDAITVWTDTERTKFRKHYLALFLWEPYAVYCELKGREIEKGLSFLSICNLWQRNILLLQNSTKSQCKFLIHEKVFLKLEAIGEVYNSSLWNKVLCSVELNRDCWLAV